MKRTKLAGLDVVLAGGRDGDGGGDGPCLVLLHGFGAGGEDLVPLGRFLDAPAGTRFCFPAGVMSLGLPFSDARAWWMIDLGRLERDFAAGRGLALLREAPPGLAAARERITALLPLLGPPDQIVLGAFSQGAMLACDTALRADTPPRALVLLSGAPIADAAWEPRLSRLRGVPTFVSHGRHDPLLPYEGGQRLRLLLEGGGARVTFEDFDGGHDIPAEILAALGGFLGEVLG